MTKEEAIKIFNEVLLFGKARCTQTEFEELAKMSIKALEQEPIFSRILEKTYNDFCNCDGGEGWLKIDGKEYVTDVGYAIEGVEIFMEILKRRLAESEEYVNFADDLIPIMDEAESEE